MVDLITTFRQNIQQADLEFKNLSFCFDGLCEGQTMANYEIARFDQMDTVRCPCGFSKRAFAGPDNATATMHVVDIEKDARVHYHKKLTEIYFVLEGDGSMELDGERIPVEPLTAIFIKPGCRHRAVGKMKIVNVSIPPFDPEDEWFD